MDFCSVVFLFRFLPIFLICYYLVPGGMKNMILLLGSLFYYAWADPKYLPLLVLEVLLGYLGGIWLERLKKGRGFVLTLLVSLYAVTMGLLAYGSMGTDVLRLFLDVRVLPLKTVAPVGFTLYTMQLIGYLADVYRREIPAEKAFFCFATFVTMFPRAMVGHLQGYGEMSSELHNRRMDIMQISAGAKRFCIGFAKKAILGDSLLRLWQEIQELGINDLSVATAWLGMAAYGLALYYILSGYSDMALGLAGCLGFELPENFDYPFLSKSITELIGKWFLSLGRWFQNYLYRPIAGTGKSILRVLAGALLTGALYGLWYGAGWHYMLWGLWFAFFLFLEHVLLGRIWKVLPGMLGWVYTMGVTLTGMSLFALEDPGESIQYICTMWGGSRLLDHRFLYMGKEYLVILAVAILCACPLISRMIKGLSCKKTGSAMSLYRLGEKIFPPALFLLAMIFMIGRQ